MVPDPVSSPANVVIGGHLIPAGSGISIEGEEEPTEIAENLSFVDQVVKETEQELALKKRKVYVTYMNLGCMLYCLLALHMF